MDTCTIIIANIIILSILILIGPGLELKLLHHAYFLPAVVKEPPYKIQVSGNGSFDILIKVYFNNNEKAKFQYGLQLYTCQVSTVLKDVFTFENPSKNFREMLILAGGQPCHSQKLPTGTSTSWKEKPKKRSSESISATPPKSKKKRRLEIDIIKDDDSYVATPIVSYDSSSDDEWTLSQAIKDK